MVPILIDMLGLFSMSFFCFLLLVILPSIASCINEPQKLILVLENYFE